MDYKDTLLLPKTKFPMRGNLPQNEPKKYKKWDESDIYNKIIRNRKDAKESFTLHDGPPYANGNIHIGHSLNKILKDIIIKHNYFQGKSVRFTPGWDCHGLPIEQKVEEKIGAKKKKELKKSKIRELCRKHARKFVDIQKDEFKTLGIIADWKKPYVTMDFKFEANIYRELAKIAQTGLLIERSKPVYWSWAAETALAEAEVEYQDKISPSIFVAFSLEDNALKAIDVDNAKIIIWTTTPWTLPANSGISLNPTEKYVLTDDNFIVAEKLYSSLKDSEIISGEIVKEINQNNLENLYAINPLNGRKSKIVLGEHVLMDSGTGAVHTAPGHGEDDYKVGLKYDLDVIMPVDKKGCYDKTILDMELLPEEFLGMNVFEANDKILEMLGENLLKKVDINHSYPHCWRTHKPIIFRATRQWFISMDKEVENGLTLRDIALKEIEKTDFYPEAGRNRLKAMISDRPDWCISRQRDWGVPIAFFREKATGKIIFDEKVLNYISMIFDIKGADAWYDLTIEELLYPGSGYKAEDLEKVNDILDVWFDSGSTQYAVLQSRNYDAGNFQADLYLEGSDQHRGWFQSSLLVSSITNKKAPYKSILTHGFTVDSNGEKMSKSKGNVVAPKDVLKKYGSEILRLWVAMSDYQNDLKISDNILSQNGEQYRKLRNTFRFLLANINDLDKLISTDNMSEVDKWILLKAKNIFDTAKDNFDKYEFSKGLHLINGFITNELSGIYLDLCKDRLYCDAKDSVHRRSSQTAMAIITKSLLGLIAPILTYTADEILEYAPKVIKDDTEDIFDFIYQPISPISTNIDFEKLIQVKEKFSEAIDTLKKDKIIKNTLELNISTDIEAILKLDKIEAEDWFIVSEINSEFKDEPLVSITIDDRRVEIYKALKSKCPRCWKYNSENEDEICSRCNKVVE